MSIPKQPRQLMINIMYLVLTALLALNVSAEIFNAFKVVNKGLEESNAILEENSRNIPNQVKERAKKDPEKYQTYADRVDPVRDITKDFTDYVDYVIDTLVMASGGYAVDEETGEKLNIPKNYKDKDHTTRILVGLEPQDREGLGHELEEKILALKDEYIQFFDEEDKAVYSDQITLDVDDAYEESNDKVNWAHYNFQQMPILAVLPILNKIKNDAKATEASVLNYLLSKSGGEEIEFKNFQVVSAPEKSYVIRGETFETDIFLAATASNVEDMSISVNGRSLPVDNGVAHFETSASSTGIKSYTATVNLKNPVTGEPLTVTKEFEFEVGERSVNVAAEKMNVLYMGVDNPISVSAAGVSTNELRVSGSGGGISLKKSGTGKYVANVSQQGEAIITVSGGGLTSTRFPFRVKRIPSPEARLSTSSGGAMGNGTFKAQSGVGAFLDDFDFDATCQIAGFQLVRVAPRQDPQPVVNQGARYNAEAQALVNQAKPGDTYYFNNVRAKCPGDKATRPINSMVFNIR